MKTPVLATLLVLVVTATSSAQGTPTEKARAQMHSGTVKIWLGVVLIGAGSLVIPLTATSDRTTTPNGTALGVGVGAVAAGTCLIWWGAREQRKAVGRGLTFGAFVGRNTGMQVRKIW